MSGLRRYWLLALWVLTGPLVAAVALLGGNDGETALAAASSATGVVVFVTSGIHTFRSMGARKP